MPALPFALGSFRRQASRLPELRLFNCYPEKVAGGEVILIGRPATDDYATVGNGPIRGMFSEPGALLGDLFAVSGGALYRGALNIGFIPGTTRVVMAGTGNRMLIATGGALYATDGEAVEAQLFPDDADVVWVGRLGGYFIAIRGNDSQRFYWSDDGVTWIALDFASAERKPDELVGGLVVGDELWMFGKATVEFFYQTSDPDALFQRIEGRQFTKGCLARDTIALHDNAATFVGSDGIVYRGGAVPERISTHSIEERIAAVAPGDLRAWAFPWKGHAFYLLTIGSQGTWAYDPASGEWSEWGSYGRTAFRAHVGVQYGTSIVAGDDRTGALYILTDDIAEDTGDNPILREFTAIAATDQPFTCYNLTLDAAVGATADLTGQGTDPQIEMRYSDDYGNTWCPWEPVSLGRAGEYRVRPVWNGLGMIDAPGRVFGFRLSDPAPYRISRVAANENLRGKAR